MRLVALVAATLSLLLAAVPTAAKKKPPVCPAASYVLDLAEPLGPAGVAGFPDVIEIDDEGNVSVASSCPDVPGKLKGSKKGDKVSAKWDKEVCDQLLGKPKLKARIAPDCLSMEGKFKAKKRKKVKFTATRPPAVTPVLEPERRNAATVGPGGGSVSAEGSNGVVYTLEIPEFALLEETEVALTPVAAIPDLPFSGGLAGSVEFEPDGLQLYRAAMLRIDVPGGFVPPAGTQLVGFGSKSGQSFHARIAQEDAGEITVPISHFSGGGAAGASTAELQALLDRPNPLREFFISHARQRMGDPASYAEWVRSTFGVVRTALEATIAFDPDLELRLFFDWTTIAVSWPLIFGFDSGLDASETDALLDEGVALLAEVLRAAVDRDNVACLADPDAPDFDRARAAVRWQTIADGLFREALRGPRLEPEFLDRERVLDELCVNVAIETVTFPGAPVVGVPSPLRVDVISTADTPVRVTADPVEGLAELAPVSSVVTGVPFETAFTSTGAALLEIDVVACLDVAGLEEVCDLASVVRGLTLLPAFMVLEPGETQQFEAAIFGAPIANPVWTATGGAITQTGLYTAGSQPGEFVVTVSSVDHPGLEANAAITISPGGFSRLSVVRRGQGEEQTFEGIGASVLALGNTTEQSTVAFGDVGEPVLLATGAANAPGQAATSSVSFILVFTTDRPLDFAIDLAAQASTQATASVTWCPGGACMNVSGNFVDSGVLPAGTHELSASLFACGGAALGRGVCAGVGSASYDFSLVLTEPAP